MTVALELSNAQVAALKAKAAAAVSRGHRPEPARDVRRVRGRFLMIAAVADTHAALWYIYSDARLSAVSKSVFEGAAKGRRKIAISTISLAEIVYLVEKHRMTATVYDELQRALRNPSHVLQEAPVTGDIIDAMRQVSRADIPDMPDRIVAATGIYHDVPVISRDGRIRASIVRTIW